MMDSYSYSEQIMSVSAEPVKGRFAVWHSIYRHLSTGSALTIKLFKFLFIYMAVFGFAVTSILSPAIAQQAMPPAPYAYKQLDDPRKEAEAKALMETLRCLKCQSQSIADSDAPMAGDMRHQVRTRIAAGEDPEQVRGWLIERYGDWVSYAPTISAVTWPLWAAPILLIVIALFLMRGRFRRRRRRDGGQP